MTEREFFWLLLKYFNGLKRSDMDFAGFADDVADMYSLLVKGEPSQRGYCFFDKMRFEMGFAYRLNNDMPEEQLAVLAKGSGVCNSLIRSGVLKSCCDKL